MFGSLPASGQPLWLLGGTGWKGGSHRFVGRLTELWKVQTLYCTTGLAGPGEAGTVGGFGVGPWWYRSRCWRPSMRICSPAGIPAAAASCGT